MCWLDNLDVVWINVKTKAPVLKFINTQQPFDLHKQYRKTCLDLTSPPPENELNEPVLDVNELIILTDFFYLETNDIIMASEQVYNKVILIWGKKCPKILSATCP